MDLDSSCCGTKSKERVLREKDLSLIFLTYN